MVYQYYIMELQTYQDGSHGHIVHFAWDNDEHMARLKGESKYYEILAAAAVSTLPAHGVALLNWWGEPIMNKCYEHKA